MRIPNFLLCAIAIFTTPAFAAALPEIPLPTAPAYADLADLALAAPVVAGVTIGEATRLKGAYAADVPAGHARFYVAASVQSLIRGAQGLPGQVSYLVDVPLDAKNRAPKLVKARALVLASATGKPGELRLIAPQAQLPWTEPLERQIRAILTEANGAEAPPTVTGIASAFHVPGSLPGESETQIFLATADGRPVSLSVLRRPDEITHWAVALGEMVDEAAAPPAPDTLLWYRLACTLPSALPAAVTGALAEPDATAAAADYRLVMDGLGPCTRNYARSGAQKEESSTPTAAQSE